MPSANLNISVIERRMLSQAEAAHYTGLAARYFKAVCPVPPVEMRPGKFLWDKRDLDKWIDAKKEGAEVATQSAILAKLE